ncbi:MAG: T9SS type A sorting domain-containing protein [Candidatus Eisenbacteria bacterium]|nr:T9SS type A sorting domain-containing protein [Candidatus Eisenbacteria bacterium]
MVLKAPIRRAALAALLLGTLAGPAAAGFIEDVGVIPNPFSPNGDGVFDETALYYTLTDTFLVTITVSGFDGWGPDTLRHAFESEGGHSLWWDGTSGGETVSDGACYFLIVAQPQRATAEEAQATVFVDTAAPAPGIYMVSPSRFSPDGDGVADSLLVSLEFEAPEPTDEVTAFVTETDGTMVRRLYSATGVWQASFHWNGKDHGGSAAPDGLYHVRFGIRDAASNETVSTVLIDLDTAPPYLSADYPDPEVLEFRFDTAEGLVSGRAGDRSGVVAVEYSYDQESWEPAIVARADSVDWSATVHCESCAPGETDETVQIHIRAYDGTPTAEGHGHVNSSTSSNPILTFDAVFDVAPPVHESSTLSGGEGPFTPGQQISISTRWDESSYDVTGDFSMVDSLFDPDNVAVTSQSGGRYTVRYTLSQDMPIPDGERPVIITATDRFATPSGEVVRSVSDTTVYVTVVAPTNEIVGLSIDVNSFNPATGEQVTISIGATQARAKISIFNMRGTLVRTLEGDAVSSLVWDGKNDNGDVAASGVYFLWIQTDGGEATRKVAIVK